MESTLFIVSYLISIIYYTNFTSKACLEIEKQIMLNNNPLIVENLSISESN